MIYDDTNNGYYMVNKPSCQWFNTNILEWIGDGCNTTVIATSTNTILCSCNHLTDFAIAYTQQEILVSSNTTNNNLLNIIFFIIYLIICIITILQILRLCIWQRRSNTSTYLLSLYTYISIFIISILRSILMILQYINIISYSLAINNVFILIPLLAERFLLSFLLIQFIKIHEDILLFGVNNNSTNQQRNNTSLWFQLNFINIIFSIAGIILIMAIAVVPSELLQKGIAVTAIISCCIMIFLLVLYIITTLITRILPLSLHQRSVSGLSALSLWILLITSLIVVQVIMLLYDAAMTILDGNDMTALENAGFYAVDCIALVTSLFVIIRFFKSDTSSSGQSVKQIHTRSATHTFVAAPTSSDADKTLSERDTIGVPVVPTIALPSHRSVVSSNDINFDDSSRQATSRSMTVHATINLNSGRGSSRNTYQSDVRGIDEEIPILTISEDGVLPIATTRNRRSSWVGLKAHVKSGALRQLKLDSNGNLNTPNNEYESGYNHSDQSSTVTSVDTCRPLRQATLTRMPTVTRFTESSGQVLSPRRQHDDEPRTDRTGKSTRGRNFPVQRTATVTRQ